MGKEGGKRESFLQEEKEIKPLYTLGTVFEKGRISGGA